MFYRLIATLFGDTIAKFLNALVSSKYFWGVVAAVLVAFAGWWVMNLHTTNATQAQTIEQLEAQVEELEGKLNKSRDQIEFERRQCKELREDIEDINFDYDGVLGSINSLRGCNPSGTPLWKEVNSSESAPVNEDDTSEPKRVEHHYEPPLDAEATSSSTENIYYEETNRNLDKRILDIMCNDGLIVQAACQRNASD